jgi:hypothetical protein
MVGSSLQTSTGHQERAACMIEQGDFSDPHMQMACNRDGILSCQEQGAEMQKVPVQALIEGVHAVDELLHVVLVVSNSHRVTVEVIPTCDIAIAVTCGS